MFTCGLNNCNDKGIMNDKKIAKDGSVPDRLLEELNQHTVGGFVLFYFNSIDGAPEQAMIFDSPAHSLGLQKHILDWSVALQEINVDEERESFTAACGNKLLTEEGDELV